MNIFLHIYYKCRMLNNKHTKSNLKQYAASRLEAKVRELQALPPCLFDFAYAPSSLFTPTCFP